MRNGPPIQFDDDMRLMIRAREGDRSAYDQLYSRYFPTVMSFFSRYKGQSHVREDLAQEVFARVWERRTKYQPLAPVRSYLLGVAANVLRERRAKAHSPVPVDIRSLETLADTSRPSPPSQAQSAEQLQAIRALMASLPTRQRQAVELVYLAGLTPAEAARRLACSLGSLYYLLSSARQKLRYLACVLQKESRI